MNKVLIITEHFPPRASIASVRLNGLAKYLPSHGWEPIILVPQLPGPPEACYRVVEVPYSGDVFKRIKKRLGMDPKKRLQEHLGIPYSAREGKNSLANKLEHVVRSFMLYPSKRRMWAPLAIKTGTNILKTEPIKALISSSSPVITHLIANELKKRFQVPWAADFRDLWTQNHYYPHNALRKWFEQKLELKILKEADILITVSEPLVKTLREFHNGKIVLSILNGFDPDELGHAELTKRFTITYTGTLYRGKRDPSLLFKVVRELLDEQMLDESAIEIRFFGPSQYWLEKEIKENRLEKVAREYGVVQREEALNHQRESQLLLLLNWDNPAERGVYTGKVFEYLAAQRPILAIGGPKGVISDLMEDTHAGVHTSNKTDLKKALMAYYHEYKSQGHVSYKVKPGVIDEYSHREMARKFSQALDSISC
ncbi:MAG: glycosyltransferase family protein [Planctomycetota bacterium]|jgi:hypothetical protein